VVDGDVDSAKALSFALERAGWLVIVVHTVEAARHVLGLVLPDLVVVEPAGSRDPQEIELAKLARSGLPIVIASADHAWDGAAPRYGHLKKPIDVHTVAADLVAILETIR